MNSFAVLVTFSGVLDSRDALRLINRPSLRGARVSSSDPLTVGATVDADDLLGAIGSLVGAVREFNGAAAATIANAIEVTAPELPETMDATTAS